MRKTQTLTNKPVYLGLSILDLSKTEMYEFWNDCVIPKCCEIAKNYYMDTDSFIVHVKWKINKKTLQKMFKQDLAFQFLNFTYHYLK